MYCTPQGYVTSVGEYLMMLPQLLEPIMAGTEGEGGAEEGDDTDWLDKARPCGCCSS